MTTAITRQFSRQTASSRPAAGPRARGDARPALVSVMGAADAGPRVDVMGVSDPAFADFVFTGRRLARGDL